MAKTWRVNSSTSQTSVHLTYFDRAEMSPSRDANGVTLHSSVEEVALVAFLDSISFETTFTLLVALFFRSKHSLRSVDLCARPF